MKNSCVPYQQNRREAEKNIKMREEYTNSKGKKVKIRRNHMTEESILKKRKIYKDHIKNVPLPIKHKAGDVFFNPYRYSGVYFGCVQSLFLLGANDWYSFNDVKDMLKQVMMKMKPDKHGKKPWEKFEGRSPRPSKNGGEAPGAKDLDGRIQHNMRVLQRVFIEKEANPYGYKLRQALACIDIRVTDEIFWSFCLNTRFKNEAEVKPIFEKITSKGKVQSKAAAK